MVVADDVPSSSHTTSVEPLPSFFNQRLIKEAHIAWALNCVKSVYSDNSADYFGNVLRCICPNDKVADISNGTKKAYVYCELWIVFLF